VHTMNMSQRCLAVAVAALCFWSADVAGQQRKPKPPGDRITCSFESALYFPFGYYDPFQPSDLDVVSYITYSCSALSRQSARPQTSIGLAPRRQQMLEISIGTGLSGSFDRRMTGVGDTLVYNIYHDAARTQIWGDGTHGTVVHTKEVFDNGSVQSVPMFGRMPAGQSVNGGAYFDALVVTIDF